MRGAHPDWLQHRLDVTGSEDALQAFRLAAAGPGVVPWHHDADALAEDWYHLLMRPPRVLSAEGAHVLSRQLRDAVWEGHERMLAQVATSRIVFDLHALVPVPQPFLRRGPDDPASLDWLWRHWGTTWPLRRVEALSAESGFACRFWSADWTPWPVMAAIRARFPGLSVGVTPVYGV